MDGVNFAFSFNSSNSIQILCKELLESFQLKVGYSLLYASIYSHSLYRMFLSHV